MMEKKYEQYKLEWMVDHNHTIAEMFNGISEIMNENPGISFDEARDIWEEEIGFNGEIWACFDEWMDNNG